VSALTEDRLPDGGDIDSSSGHPPGEHPATQEPIWLENAAETVALLKNIEATSVRLTRARGLLAYRDLRSGRRQRKLFRKGAMLDESA
jgi:hypothetical protein